MRIWTDGYLFAAPENLATLAGVMKDFFDRTYYAVLERLNGRPYAQIISAGSDGTGAARRLARIATGWRLREAAEPLIVVTPAQTPEAILAPKVVAADPAAGTRTGGGAGGRACDGDLVARRRDGMWPRAADAVNLSLVEIASRYL